MTDALPLQHERRNPTRRRSFISRFLHTPGGLVGLVLVAAVSMTALLAPRLAPGQAFSFSNPVLSPPSWNYPMGTDDGGVDMLKAVVQAVRTSMTVVVWVVVLSSIIGLSLGLLAGYRGGIVDDFVTRLTELVQAIPRFFLAMLVIALYGPGLNKIILVLGLTSWTLLTRVARAETLSLRQRPFVEASRSSGATSRRILLRHVLPNVLPRVTVVVMLMGSRVILIEAGLAFLGLGDRRTPSLGVLASNAQSFLRQAWWMSFFPGIAIVIVVLGMNLLSDGLNRVLDPQTDKVRGFRAPSAGR